MGRQLSELTPECRALAVEFLARLTEAQIPCLIACTGRTATEQAEAVRKGTSKVERSRHQDGCAVDVVPYAIFQIAGPDKLLWDGSDPVWRRIGAIAERLGLRWGGRFGESAPGAGDGWDPGHVELPR
jgi:hypothetical protein